MLLSRDSHKFLNRYLKVYYFGTAISFLVGDDDSGPEDQQE
jgi:hypothetical protein